MLLDAKAAGKLKDLMASSPLTNEQLAEAVGINPDSSRQNKDKSLKRMFQRIETAGTLAIIGKVCSALEIDPLQFLFPEIGPKLITASKTPDVFEQAAGLSHKELQDLRVLVDLLMKRKKES